MLSHFAFFSFSISLVFFLFFFFFFNDTATTEIYTLSLHDALPISAFLPMWLSASPSPTVVVVLPSPGGVRSEEHTSELQSRLHLVCRLLLEKKKKNKKKNNKYTKINKTR